MELEQRINGKTRLLGLLGNPVEHTISPLIHNTLCEILGVNCVYVPMKVKKEELSNAAIGLKALDFVGFNVTIPYKKDIMKYLDDNSKEAILMGAVNTVKNIDGRLYGYNTDGEGFLKSFKEKTKESFKGKKVFIIGAGGAARSIAVKVAIEGAKMISIVNRTPEKAAEIAEIINENIKEIVQVYNFGDKTMEMALIDSDIIINTTSVGMSPNVDEMPIENIDLLNQNQIVYDVIYNPEETMLLKKAREKGLRTVNGLGMLIYQGVMAFEMWTGLKVSEEIVNEIYKIIGNGRLL